MLRYTTDRARSGLVALYDIRPGNGVGQFLEYCFFGCLVFNLLTSFKQLCRITGQHTKILSVIMFVCFHLWNVRLQMANCGCFCVSNFLYRIFFMWITHSRSSGAVLRQNHAYCTQDFTATSRSMYAVYIVYEWQKHHAQILINYTFTIMHIIQKFLHNLGPAVITCTVC